MTRVRTWCRVCGLPELVDVPNDYEWAVEAMCWVDDQAGQHGEHREPGGWGVHWRLDEVLAAMFPDRHLDRLFPVPTWYPYPFDPELERGIVRVAPR